MTLKSFVRKINLKKKKRVKVFFKNKYTHPKLTEEENDFKKFC